MSGYVYRGGTPENPSALAQRNEQLTAQLSAAQHRIQQLSKDVSGLTSTRDAQRGQILQLTRERAEAQAASRTTGPDPDLTVHHARERNLLTAVRSERQEAARTAQQCAAERNRRTHAETALSRAEQALQELRDEVAEDHRARADTVITESTQSRENARLTQRVADLEGALADSQQMRTEALAERDRALAEALTMQAVLDETYTNINGALPSMWAVRRHHNEIKKKEVA